MSVGIGELGVGGRDGVGWGAWAIVERWGLPGSADRPSDELLGRIARSGCPVCSIKD